MHDRTGKLQVKVKFLHPVWEEHIFEKATAHSAGIDLRACFDTEYMDIAPGDRLKISTGIAIEITCPEIAGFVYSRSGLGAKDGLVVAQGVGVIDPDYRGQIFVFLLNTSRETKRIERGQRIAQLIFQAYYPAVFSPVKELSSTKRGSGGFGHTGKH